MRKIFFLTIILFTWAISFSQTQREMDSLNNVLATSKEDTAKVSALARISFYENDPAKRFQLVNDALVLTRKIKYEKGEAICFQQLGNHFSRIADYPKALEYYFKSLKIREHIGDQEGMSASKSSIGNVYSNQQNYKTGLVYYYQSVEDLKKVASPNATRWPSLYAYIAGVYYQQNILDSALLYYNRSNEAAMSTNSKFQLSGSLTGLGDVHAALGNFDLALSFFRKSIS
ncbi:MAG: tetratricopeptide repeat-containing protein, partial [Bacteroidota bacterium]|nr:tetratricopeptide repeat-containing protein [Bacteroidota bacterium]